MVRQAVPASSFIQLNYLIEPVYRLAEKEFKDFIDKFTDLLSEEDPQIPPLPPKDVIHRIYRDVCNIPTTAAAID
jgi:hypothetical protein